MVVIHSGMECVQLCGLCKECIMWEEVEGLVSVERWSCSRGVSCVVEDTMGRLRNWSQ